MTTPTSDKATAPVNEIGYQVAIPYYWWLYENETTPELLWPQSVFVYDQMRRTDSQVKSVLKAISLPVMSTAWRVDPNGARPEVVELVADDLGLPIVGKDPKPLPRSRDRFSWSQHLLEALLMLPFGYSYFEQLYRANGDATRYHLRKLALRPAMSIQKVNVAVDGGLVSIEQYGAPNVGKQHEPIPVNRLVAYVNEREGGNWLGTSILRNCYKNWLLKDRLLRVWAQTIERNGMGIPLYTGQDGAPDLSTGLAMAKAWRAGDAAGTAIPFGAKLDLVGVTGTLPDAKPAVEYHDDSIARSALAHFLNLGQAQGTGSWALGTTFADFFTVSLQTLAQQIADTATQHVVEDLVDVNWGEDEPSPRICFDDIGGQQPANAEALKTLVDAGVLRPDEVLERQTRQRYGLPPADPKSQPAVPSTPTPDQGGGAAPTPTPQRTTADVGQYSVAASAGDDPDEPDEPEDPDGGGQDGPDDDPDPVDPQPVAAAAHDVSGELRNPRGAVGGGRFRSATQQIVRNLQAWLDGGMKGDSPLTAATPGQLRATARELGVPTTTRMSKPALLSVIGRHVEGEHAAGRKLPNLEGEAAKVAPEPPGPRELARRKYEAVAKARPYASAAAEMHDLLGKKASNATIAEHLRAIGDHPDMVEAGRSGANRESIRRDLESVASAFEQNNQPLAKRRMTALLKRQGLTVEGAPGKAEPFNPSTHEHVGTPPAEGASVSVIRPGVTLQRGEGDHVQLSKAVVGSPPAKAAKKAAPRKATSAQTAAAAKVTETAQRLRDVKSEDEAIKLLAGDPSLTSAKLKAVADELGIDVPPDMRAKSSLQMHIAEKAAARKAAPRQTAPKPDLEQAARRDVEVENRIRAAYDQTPKLPGGGVKIADLREHLGDLPRSEVDAALVRMGRAPRISVLPNEDQGRLSAADKAAAVELGGGSPGHYLLIEDGNAPRPLPGGKPDLEQAARDRQAKIDKARAVAESLAEVEQLNNDQASPQALEHRIRSRAKVNGLPDETTQRLLGAAAPDLTGKNGLSSDPAVREVQVENRIRAAYRKLPKSNRPGRNYVSLADIRDSPTLADVSRTEVDRALRGLVGQQGAYLELADVLATLTPRERAASVRVGGEDNHFLRLDDTSPRPLPGAGELDRLAAEHGLTRATGPAGSVEKFNPAKHDDGGAGLRQGQDVLVTSPGYTATVDGEQVPVQRAKVLEATASEAGKKSSVRDELAKAGVDVQPGSLREAAVKRAESGDTADLHNLAKHLRDASETQRGLASMRFGNNRPGSLQHNKAQENLDEADRLEAAARAIEKIAGSPVPKEAPLTSVHTPKRRVTAVPVSAVVREGASSDSSTWKVDSLDGLERPVPGAAAAVTAYLRRPGFVNSRLRTPNEPLDPSAHELLGLKPHDPERQAKAAARADRQIQALDRVMEQSRLDSPMTTYRGAWLSDIGLPATGDVVGHEWTDAGFVSTSMRRGVAEHSFAGGSSSVLLTIRAPGGTPVLQIGGLGEDEALLGRGQTYRVVADLGTTSAGARHLEVEVVPKAATSADPLAGMEGLTQVQKRARLRKQGLSKEQIDALAPLGKAPRRAAVAPPPAASKRVVAARAEIDRLIAEAAPLAAENAKLEQTTRAFTSADHRTYAQNSGRLADLVGRGDVAARDLFATLVEEQGSPWGGDASATAPRWHRDTPQVSGARNLDEWQKLRDSYVANDLKTIQHNASLRSDQPTAAAKSWRSRMDRMVGSSEVLRDTTVYRGAAMSPEDLIRLRPGAVIHDRGFVSTDESPSTADGYAGARLRKMPGTIRTNFEIRVPAGTPATNVGYGEIVLGRDGRFRVVSSEMRPDGSVWVVMELVR